MYLISTGFGITPETVAQSIFALLIEIGSPAPPPKTRGKSAGWQKKEKKDLSYCQKTIFKTEKIEKESQLI